MTSFRQANFSGGEIAPALAGRGDLERYATSLKTCRNMIPLPMGGCANRPGLQYKGEVKDNDATVRLVPFIYSDTDTYVLEFGNLYIRFWKNGALLGAPYEVTTTYATADLPYLKYAQVGDVLWLACKGYAPKKLARSSDMSWALSEVAFYQGSATPEIYHPYSASYPNNLVVYASDASSWTEDVANGLPSRAWSWKVTAVVEVDGTLYETLPISVTLKATVVAAVFTTSTLPSELPLYPQKPKKIMSNLLGAGGTPTATDRIVEYRIYRGRGSIYGYVGRADPWPNGPDFTDIGEEPDYEIRPPDGRNPLRILDASGGTIRAETAAAIAFFEQRLALAGTLQRPGWFWLSMLGDYYRFDKNFPVAEDGSVEFELASLRREEIRSQVGADKLFLFTSGGVWTVAGNGGPLTALSIQAIKHTDEGATWLSPLNVRDVLLYVRSKGVGVNMLDFEQAREKYSINDLTVVTRHLFEGLTIEDWCYAHDPHNVIWAVRSDGKLLSLTFNRSLNVWGWALHETDGEVESICSVPEGTEDAVYAVVKRTIRGNLTRRYVERLATRAVPAIASSIFLDASVSYSVNPDITYDSSTGEFGGLDHLEGRLVYVVADGAVFGPLPVSLGKATLPVSLAVTKAHIGIGYTSRFELLDVYVDKLDIRSKKKRVTSALVDVTDSASFWAGESFSDMVQARTRLVADGYGVAPLETASVLVRLRGTWNTGARVCIEMRDPLPLTIAGLTREIEIGES